jgi:hypothetical protein
MPQILDAGIATGLSNLNVDGRLRLNPAEQKFVTYVNDVGGVHTVIADLDHPAETGEDLLRWFLATKAAVESGRYDDNPQGVLDHATQVVEHGHPFKKPDAPSDPTSSGRFG